MNILKVNFEKPRFKNDKQYIFVYIKCPFTFIIYITEITEVIFFQLVTLWHVCCCLQGSASFWTNKYTVCKIKFLNK